MTRLHPLSAVTDAFGRGVQVGSFGLFAGIVLSGPLGVTDLPAAVVLAPLGFLLGAAYAVARYYRFEYELRPETLVVTSGVFARQEREIPLRRVQNVDVRRTVVHRALGIAVVRFETAGGASTEAELDAVSAAEADWLREEVGARARRGREGAGDRGRGRDRAAATESPESVESTEQAGAVESVEPVDAPESAASAESGERVEGEPDRETLYEMTTGELLALAAVSFRPGAVAAPFLGAPVFGDAFFELLEPVFRALGVTAGLPAGELTLLDAVALLGSSLVVLATAALTTWVASAALTVARFYDFRLERVADELRYERGLLGRYSGTVPLGKVQTVTLGENAPMRRLGYASLAVETAGYAPGSGGRGGGGGAETAVPLASRGRAVELARDVLADAEGIETNPFAPGTLARPPTRARRRYAIRYGLVLVGAACVLLAFDALVGLLPWPTPLLPLVALPIAVVAGRAKWRNRGHAALGDAFVARTGFWRRATRVVPYYRLQTVFITRTVFQRRWGIASVTADTASTSGVLGGDATAHDVDDAVADSLREELIERLREDLVRRRSADQTS